MRSKGTLRDVTRGDLYPVKTRADRANGSVAVCPSPLPARLWAPEAAGPARPARCCERSGERRAPPVSVTAPPEAPLPLSKKYRPLFLLLFPATRFLQLISRVGSGAGRGREAVAPTGLRACPNPAPALGLPRLGDGLPKASY